MNWKNRENDLNSIANEDRPCVQRGTENESKIKTGGLGPAQAVVRRTFRQSIYLKVRPVTHWATDVDIFRRCRESCVDPGIIRV